MSERNAGLTLDPLFVGATRPPMRWGVTYLALLGEMVITLEPEGGPGCYRYRSVSKPVGLVRMFYGAPSETSEFCVVDGRVVPQRFEFHHPKNAGESFTLEFDTPGKVVKSSRGDVRPLPENAQDRFGLHQAVRLWLMQGAARENPGEAEFTLVDEDRARHYRFGLTGRTRLRTAAGTFDTLVVERINDKRKITRFWIAPDVGYMPVQVERIKDGKVQFRMVLEP